MKSKLPTRVKVEGKWWDPFSLKDHLGLSYCAAYQRIMVYHKTKDAAKLLELKNDNMVRDTKGIKRRNVGKGEFTSCSKLI